MTQLLGPWYRKIGLYIRPNNVSGCWLLAIGATTYRSQTNRPTGCRWLVGWLVGWIDLYKIYRPNIARASKLASLTGLSRSRPMVVGRIYRRRVSRDWFPQSHWTPVESATPIPWSPAPARLPLAAAQWRARDKPVVTVTSGPGNAKARIGSWVCECVHRTLGSMRMRTSEPGDANASIGSMEYECVQIIMFIMLVLVV